MPLQPPADVLTHTPIFRMVHVDCLPTILQRDALHAPSCVPADGLPYVGIHATQTQADRGGLRIRCGPQGVIQDYIGFYFGPRSPMLNRIRSGYNVAQIDQELIVYLVSTAQAVSEAGLGFVFTDRHSLAAVAAFRAQLQELDIVDFSLTYATWWNNTADAPDRQEKKQAEFLVHRTMPWELIQSIGVYNAAAEQRVNDILDQYPACCRPTVRRQSLWYY
jgi:hypothetical protein